MSQNPRHAQNTRPDRRPMQMASPLGVRLRHVALGCWLGLTLATTPHDSAAAQISSPASNLVPSQTSADDLAAAIADLQSKEFTKREAATRRLSAANFSALRQVLPLLTAPDAEMAWRAKEI